MLPGRLYHGHEEKLMRYGFEAIGDRGTVLINNNESVMQVYERVRMISPTTLDNSDRLSYGRPMTFYFSRTYTSQYPPMVFLIPLPASKYMFKNYQPIGQPGAWTGFRIVWQDPALPSSYPGYKGIDMGWDYCVAGPDDGSFGDGRWGMRLWDGNGNLIFDSNKRLFMFSGMLRDWTFSHITTFKGYPAAGAYDNKGYMYYYKQPFTKDGMNGFLANALTSYSVATGASYYGADYLFGFLDNDNSNVYLRQSAGTYYGPMNYYMTLQSYPVLVGRPRF